MCTVYKSYICTDNFGFVSNKSCCVDYNIGFIFNNIEMLYVVQLSECIMYINLNMKIILSNILLSNQ